MIDNCVMYRKVDWEKACCYCDYILGREDWDFWIAMFKSGGEFYRLPLTGLFYRVRNDSKRRKTQNRKRLLVDAINDRHKPFIFQQLGGPLHYKRSWSRCFNFFSKVYIAEQFNILVKHETVISDVYHLPELFKQNKRDGNDWANLDASTFILSCRNETKKHTAQIGRSHD